MREASTSRWMALGGIITSSAVIGLMLYRATALSDGSDGLLLSDNGWFVLIAGMGCLLLSVAMLAYTHSLSPEREAEVEYQEPASLQVPEPAGPPSVADIGPDLSGLKEDERRLYDMILDRGGEMLQRDLVASGDFSKAKVTRLLDKLESRELIKRERHGMTNMVKLVR